MSADPEVSGSVELFGQLSEYSSALYAFMTVLPSPSANAIAVRFRVDHTHLNAGQTLHGGCIATLVDILTSIALRKYHREGKSGVTASLTVECVNAAFEHEDLVVTAYVHKVGKNLGFTSAQLVREADGVVVATGAHVKFLGGDGVPSTRNQQQQSSRADVSPNRIAKY
jgi:acyl-coenzyme A thioesterase 13